MVLPGCLHKPFTVKELLLTVNEGQLSADEAHITEDMGTVGINLFCTDCLILKMIRKQHTPSFTLLLKRQARMSKRMQQALNEKEVDGIAAMAHKLLPLFTMIGAEETIAPLKWLEACRGEEFSEKIEETTFNTLEAVRK